MAAEVPLKIRVDIRDQWDSPKSAIQKSVESLAQTLGHTVTPHVEWPAMWNELKERFPDKTTFVPTISRIAIAWYDRLLWRLESDNFPEWTEELLGVLSSASQGVIRLEIEPAPASQKRAHTLWRANSKSFYLGIPKNEPASQAVVVSAFDQDFEDLLNPAGRSSSIDEGWANVAADIRIPEVSTSRTAYKDKPSVPQQLVFEEKQEQRLPTLGVLPRPNELLTHTAPYILIVDAKVGSFTVRSSHEPSLVLLSDYLNKWAKQNLNNSLKRNILKIELIDSAFCFGVRDTLMIEPYLNFRNAEFALNPTIVLAFIEGVLKYKLIHTDGQTWVYRSDTIFK